MTQKHRGSGKPLPHFLQMFLTERNRQPISRETRKIRQRPNACIKRQSPQPVGPQGFDVGLNLIGIRPSSGTFSGCSPPQRRCMILFGTMPLRGSTQSETKTVDVGPFQTTFHVDMISRPINTPKLFFEISSGFDGSRWKGNWQDDTRKLGKGFKDVDGKDKSIAYSGVSVRPAAVYCRDMPTAGRPKYAAILESMFVLLAPVSKCAMTVMDFCSNSGFICLAIVETEIVTRMLNPDFMRGMGEISSPKPSVGLVGSPLTPNAREWNWALSHRHP